MCVFCSSSEDIDPRYRDLAADVGRALAAAGYRLVSGGGSVSMMGAVARGARAGGGHTTGVIPRALADREVADHDADALLITDDMRSRKGAMDSRSDAFLALPGGLGTLEELLEVWVSASLGMHAKPVVVLDPDGLFRPLRDLVATLVAQGFSRAEAADVPVWVTTVPDAIAALAAGVASATVGRPTVAETLEADL